MSEPKSRREIFLKLGFGAGVAALGAQAVASLRSLVPNVSYDAPTTVKIGLPNDFPDGMKFLPDERLFVFREGKTLHAVSAVCTHLGCTVRAEALSAPETKTSAASRCASRTASSARATARSTRATARTWPAPRRSRSPGTTCRFRPTTDSSSSTSRGPWSATSASRWPEGATRHERTSR